MAFAKRVFTFPLLVLFLGFAPARGETGTALLTAEPEAVGLSAERLARIAPVMERYVEEETLAGLITLVARGGEVVHFETYGLRDLAAGAPMTADTLFRIYSMTKPITTAALMTLYEEGKFRLSDPVSKYIPEFADLEVFVRETDDGMDVEAQTREMQIVDLMRHTAGLTYGFLGNHAIDKLYREAEILDKNQTLADMAAKLGEIPLMLQPGEKWHYSVAVDVQGYLIERLSGMPLGAFLKARLFDPLGMKDTFFFVPDDKRSRFAALYTRDAETGALKAVEDERLASFLPGATFMSGGGGLVSTASDYLRFAQMMLNGGVLDGVRVLGPRTVALMTRDHLPNGLTMNGEADGQGFGLGFQIITHPAATLMPVSEGTFQWGGAASTEFWIDPEEDLVAIVMTQFLPNGRGLGLREDLAALVYQAIMGPVPARRAAEGAGDETSRAAHLR